MMYVEPTELQLRDETLLGVKELGGGETNDQGYAIDYHGDSTHASVS
tara:strand:+ start:1226 stop:1366 length:141 start_codon:yes stop_codon:yes gene_type:complete